jgi:hypothetical protein
MEANPKQTLAKLSCFIFVARSDASFIRTTLPPLFKMVNKVECKIIVILDASNAKGVLGESLKQSELSEVIEILKEIKKQHSFKMVVFSPDPSEVLQLSKIHMGRSYRETHCFRGYPIHGSIRQFHEYNSDYVLHLDCDMLFYEADGFSWIESAINLMEENKDILCTLPRGGPPALDGNLNQGSTYYKKDNLRGVYLFKNFTSRHYLIHRERFLELLPMKPLWLSWREPIKSRFFGNGKMLCWETIVERALQNSTLWRADLMTEKAWSLHPGERSKEFRKKLPAITEQVSQGNFPLAQAGHFDLRLGDWQIN